MQLTVTWKDGRTDPPAVVENLATGDADGAPVLLWTGPGGSGAIDLPQVASFTVQIT